MTVVGPLGSELYRQRHGPSAQLVAHAHDTRGVVGSRPVRPSRQRQQVVLMEVDLGMAVKDDLHWRDLCTAAIHEDAARLRLPADLLARTVVRLGSDGGLVRTERAFADTRSILQDGTGQPLPLGPARQPDRPAQLHAAGRAAPAGGAGLGAHGYGAGSSRTCGRRGESRPCAAVGQPAGSSAPVVDGVARSHSSIGSAPASSSTFAGTCLSMWPMSPR